MIRTQLHAPAQIIGCVRVCTNEQDLAAPRKVLRRLGVPEDLCRSRPDRKERERPRLNEAVAAVRAGGTLIATKPDRFARPSLMLETSSGS